ncbi:hypothetical protein PHLCEN_2v3918 [Hermanssonia centrifuga]|uniref:Uncharacterized protein n=1 Tax=Hermanssonia centrifuga TaxID=98765 RepID=A0A2R6QB47_9APHY|nr:hypothetical protein PHLCEN_2v3918 [Hermanssonia centrifuga]
MKLKHETLQSYINGFGEFYQNITKELYSVKNMIAQGGSITGTSDVEARKQEDFPKIQYWNKDNWKQERKSFIGNTNPQSTARWNPLGFLEHDNGTALTSKEESHIQRIARGVFLMMDQSMKIAPPMTWDHGAAIEHCQAFCDELESDYPEQWIKSQSPTKVSPLVVDVDMHVSADKPQPHVNLVKKRSVPDPLTGMHRHTKKAKPSGKPDLLIHDPMNVCGRKWATRHPNGTEADWEAYWSKLPESEKKKTAEKAKANDSKI